MEREPSIQMTLSASQLRQLAEFTADLTKERYGSVRLVELNALYLRVEILDADGEVAEERMLFPV